MRMRTVCVAVLVFVSVVALTRAGAQVHVIERILPPLPPGSGAIVGLVLTDTGQPASGATVSLRSPNSDTQSYQPKETVGDELGRFTFSGIPAEALELVVSKSGFLDTVYGQTRPGFSGTPIRLNSNQRLSVVMRLARGAAVSGTVFGPGGDPAPGINVYAFRLVPLSDGEDLLGSGGKAVTDDRGTYRIADLVPGRYIVMGYRDWRNIEGAPIERVGPNEFAVESNAIFRNAVDTASAERIEVRLGDRRDGIDLRLRLDSVTTVGGVVRGVDGKPAEADIQLIRVGESPVPFADVSSDADGVFEFTRVTAGDYEVLAYSESPEPHWSRKPVRSDGRTPVRVELALRPGATVSGRVVLAGRSTPAPPTDKFTFWLGGVRESLWFDVPGVEEVVVSPEFTYRGVRPGRYVITVDRQTVPAGWSMQSEIVGGRDALDFPFEITHDERRDVLITLSDQTTEIAGAITDATGAPSFDHTVVIFASDDRFWTPRSRRIETVRPDTNGRYRVRGLPAGEYIVAIGPPDIEARQPPSSLLRTLHAVSARVTLREGEKKTHNLRTRG